MERTEDTMLVKIDKEGAEYVRVEMNGDFYHNGKLVCNIVKLYEDYTKPRWKRFIQLFQ